MGGEGDRERKIRKRDWKRKREEVRRKKRKESCVFVRNTHDLFV